MTAAAYQQGLPGISQRGKVADEYRFSFIRFGRDLYKFFANEKANVAHLASLLGVTVYWGFDYFEVSQGKLGALLVDVCGVPVAPSRRSVSGYLHRLAELGYIEIPRKRSLDSVKRYRFTDKFKALLDPETRQKMWDIQLHGKGERTSSITVKPQSTPRSLHTSKVCNNKNRAINTTMTSEPEEHGSRPTRANLDKINPPKPVEKTATSRVQSKPKRHNNHRPRPARARNGSPAKLDKFQNSVRHWLFGFNGIVSIAEAEILTALFLELDTEGDPYIRQLRGNWNKDGGKGEVMTEQERSYQIRCLTGHLRTTRDYRAQALAEIHGNTTATQTEKSGEPHHTDTAPGDSPGSVTFTPEQKRVRVAKLEQAFHCALIFGDKDYDGPGAEIIARFRDATDEERTQILDDLHSGKIRPV